MKYFSLVGIFLVCNKDKSVHIATIESKSITTEPVSVVRKLYFNILSFNIYSIF